MTPANEPASRETGDAAARIMSVAIDQIRPGRTQARRRFEPGALAELAASIRESGIVQPLVVRSLAGGGYELLAGERRWRAAQLAGLQAVPAILRNDLPDREAHVLGLIENLQRESLSPMETAAGLQALGRHFDLTHEAIGARIGKSRVYVTNFLRLLALDAEVQPLIEDGHLSSGHAKVLAALTPAAQREWARRTVHEGWSVRALERRLSPRAAQKRRTAVTADHERLEAALADHLGYPVTLNAGSDGKGELKIRFHSLDELDGLLERIGYQPF